MTERQNRLVYATRQGIAVHLYPDCRVLGAAAAKLVPVTAEVEVTDHPSVFGMLRTMLATLPPPARKRPVCGYCRKRERKDADAARV